MVAYKKVGNLVVILMFRQEYNVGGSLYQAESYSPAEISPGELERRQSEQALPCRPCNRHVTHTL